MILIVASYKMGASWIKTNVFIYEANACLNTLKNIKFYTQIHFHMGNYLYLSVYFPH